MQKIRQEGEGGEYLWTDIKTNFRAQLKKTGIVNEGNTHSFCTITMNRNFPNLRYKRNVDKKKVAIAEVN